MALTKTPIELSSTQGIVDNSNATAITIDSSENVGIGLTSPDAPLSVYSPSASANIKLTRAGTSEYLQLGTYYINSTNNDLQLATTTSHPMVFKTNNTERMRISSAGNVGIGETSPDAKLDIRSSGASSYPLLIKSSDDQQLFRFREESDTRGTFYINDASENSKVTLASSGNSSFMGGNVGIGNSSPVELLTIGSTSDTNVRAQFLSSTSGANTIQFGDGTGAAAYAAI